MRLMGEADSEFVSVSIGSSDAQLIEAITVTPHKPPQLMRRFKTAVVPLLGWLVSPSFIN